MKRRSVVKDRVKIKATTYGDKKRAGKRLYADNPDFKKEAQQNDN